MDVKELNELKKFEAQAVCGTPYKHKKDLGGETAVMAEFWGTSTTSWATATAKFFDKSHTFTGS